VQNLNKSIVESTINRIIEAIVIIESTIAFISIGRFLLSTEIIVTEILTLKNREVTVLINNLIYSCCGSIAVLIYITTEKNMSLMQKIVKAKNRFVYLSHIFLRLGSASILYLAFGFDL
jgi:hypothetical protein